MRCIGRRRNGSLGLACALARYSPLERGYACGMSAVLNLSALAVVVLGLASGPACAADDPQRDWMQRRAPGAPLQDERLPDPGGLRFGPEISAPYALGLSLAYLVPAKIFTFKTGVDWGVLSESGVTGLKFPDLRLYAALMYYFLPGANDGPYVETGLDFVRSHGALLPLLNWPVVPHIGFGTVLRTGKESVWDINFAVTASGLMTLTGGMIFGAKNEDNGLTQPYEPFTP
jgi:hypothetical protein